MKSSNDIEAIRNEFKSFFTPETENEQFEHDAHILMAGYLSEFERILNEKKIRRKALAEKINTSASYLTQVFRGDKPLNFLTIAKIQKALNIRFSVEASDLASACDTSISTTRSLTSIKRSGITANLVAFLPHNDITSKVA